jgi:hypothetical protein
VVDTPAAAALIAADLRAAAGRQLRRADEHLLRVLRRSYLISYCDCFS